MAVWEIIRYGILLHAGYCLIHPYLGVTDVLASHEENHIQALFLYISLATKSHVGVWIFSVSVLVKSTEVSVSPCRKSDT